MCPCEFGEAGKGKILRNEIGLNIFNINEAMFNFTSNKPEYEQNFTNGLMFKHHLNDFSLRAGFDLVRHEYTYQAGTPQSSSYNLNDGKSRFGNFRLGIEKTLSNSKVQPYVAVDVLLSYGLNMGTSEGFGDFLPYYKQYYEFNTRVVGFSPAVGLKYRPFKHFSISAEASLSVTHYSVHRVAGGYGDARGSDVLVNPLRLLSINYHF